MTYGRPKAIIWDMDGVIADTAAYHRDAWRESFGRRGVSFSDRDFRRGFGQRNDAIIRDIMGDVPADEMEAISLEKEADYRRRIARDIRPLPGVRTLLGGLDRLGFRQAVASSAPLANITQIMGSLGISGYFELSVSAEDVTEGKPSPQAFLLAAGRLQVGPDRCIVIEDAVAGVLAARTGGMRSVAVTTTHSRRDLGAADLVVDSLEEVDAKAVARLLDAGRAEQV